MQIFLDDSNLHAPFYPLTGFKSFKKLRVGIFSIEERWLKMASIQNILLQYTNHPEDADLVIPANKIPFMDCDFHALLNKEMDVTRDFISIDHIWDLVEHNASFLSNDARFIDQSVFIDHHPSIQKTGKHSLFMHQTARIEPCFINTEEGVVIVDEHAQIMAGSMLRGPLYIGKHSVVKMGSQLYGGTNIGCHCTIGGEIKNAIFHSYTNKGHHGYIGDSYIGSWCNLGAGTTASNVKNTAGAIRIWNESLNEYCEGPRKVGVFMGDHVKTAINTMIFSGTVISSFSNIFSKKGISVPSMLPMFSWGVDEPSFYQLDHLLNDTERWMKMKNQSLTDEEKETIILLHKLHFK